ncbi:hypothetical protein NHX12_002238 [Muraenolepis orangiensis]|uniref:Uncharacterized protein n=1 Tax=Muraenolepis orangiensis TaxID=630683 RepID=A0A9Q0IEK9_9TELE|nr:hypothetical protein NHX12_002238 [Muraenolepis orangiensis]
MGLNGVHGYPPAVSGGQQAPPPSRRLSMSPAERYFVESRANMDAMKLQREPTIYRKSFNAQRTVSGPNVRLMGRHVVPGNEARKALSKPFMREPEAAPPDGGEPPIVMERQNLNEVEQTVSFLTVKDFREYVQYMKHSYLKPGDDTKKYFLTARDILDNELKKAEKVVESQADLTPLSDQNPVWDEPKEPFEQSSIDTIPNQSLHATDETVFESGDLSDQISRESQTNDFVQPSRSQAYQPIRESNRPGSREPPVRSNGPGSREPPVRSNGPGSREPPVRSNGPGSLPVLPHYQKPPQVDSVPPVQHVSLSSPAVKQSPSRSYGKTVYMSVPRRNLSIPVLPPKPAPSDQRKPPVAKKTWKNQSILSTVQMPASGYVHSASSRLPSQTSGSHAPGMSNSAMMLSDFVAFEIDGGNVAEYGDGPSRPAAVNAASPGQETLFSNTPDTQVPSYLTWAQTGTVSQESNESTDSLDLRPDVKLDSAPSSTSKSSEYFDERSADTRQTDPNYGDYNREVNRKMMDDYRILNTDSNTAVVTFEYPVPTNGALGTELLIPRRDQEKVRQRPVPSQRPRYIPASSQSALQLTRYVTNRGTYGRAKVVHSRTRYSQSLAPSEDSVKTMQRYSEHTPFLGFRKLG